MGVYRVKTSQLIVGLVLAVLLSWYKTRDFWSGSVSLAELPPNEIISVTIIALICLFACTLRVRITDREFIFFRFFIPRRIKLDQIQSMEIIAGGSSIGKRKQYHNLTIRYKKKDVDKRFTLYYFQNTYENADNMIEELQNLTGKRVKK